MRKARLKLTPAEEYEIELKRLNTSKREEDESLEARYSRGEIVFGYNPYKVVKGEELHKILQDIIAICKKPTKWGKHSIGAVLPDAMVNAEREAIQSEPLVEEWQKRAAGDKEDEF